MQLSPERGYEMILFIPNSPDSALVGQLKVEPGKGTRDEQIRMYGHRVLGMPLFPFRAYQSARMITKPIGANEQQRSRLHGINPLLAVHADYSELPELGDISAFTSDPNHYFCFSLEKTSLRFLPINGLTRE